MSDFPIELPHVSVSAIIQIAVLYFVIYAILKSAKGSRFGQALMGFGLLAALLIAFAYLFHFDVLTRIVQFLLVYIAVSTVVIFQPEIRKALEQVGRNKKWKRLITIFRQGRGDEWEQKVKKSIIDAADTATLFSHSRTGALIVFERETMLSDIAATGTVVDAETSVALFGNIFFNKAPLHDGASIIRDGKLFAAGCILPLTDNTDVDINLGTRHRAALGISEQSDAVVLVISEETGVISLAFDGELTRDYTRESLIKKLNELMLDEFEDVNTFRLKRGRKSK